MLSPCASMSTRSRIYGVHAPPSCMVQYMTKPARRAPSSQNEETPLRGATRLVGWGVFVIADSENGNKNQSVEHEHTRVESQICYQDSSGYESLMVRPPGFEPGRL